MTDTSASIPVAGSTAEQRVKVRQMLTIRAGLAAESREMTNDALASKFAVSNASIDKAINGQTSRYLNQGDVDYIQQVVEKREKVRAEMRLYTPAAIAEAVGIKETTVRRLTSRFIMRGQVPLAIKRRIVRKGV